MGGRTEGLRDPGRLLAVVGQAPRELRVDGGARPVHGLTEHTSGYAFTLMFQVAVAAGSVAPLVPVVVFMVMVTRVASGTRLAGVSRSRRTRGRSW